MANTSWMDALRSYSEPLWLLFVLAGVVWSVLKAFHLFQTKLETEKKKIEAAVLARKNEQTQREKKYQEDAEKWYNTSQAAFSEIGWLRRSYFILEQHVTNLEFTLHRYGIKVPPRPVLKQDEIIRRPSGPGPNGNRY